MGFINWVAKNHLSKKNKKINQYVKNLKLNSRDTKF